MKTLVTFENGKILIVEKGKNDKSKGASIVHELNDQDENEMLYSMWVEGKFKSFNTYLTLFMNKK